MPGFVNDLERGGCLRLFSVLTDGKMHLGVEHPKMTTFHVTRSFAEFRGKNKSDQTVLEWWLERVNPWTAAGSA